MAHTSCRLDKQGYMHTRLCTRPRSRAHARARTHTLTQICNCFSNATVVRWMRLSVTLYVHCFSYFVSTLFHKISKSACWLYHVCLFSVCPHVTTRLPRRIFSKSDILFFGKYVERNKVWWNMTRITGTLRECVCTFVIVYRWVLLRMRDVQSCRENENTHFVFNNYFFIKWYHLWDNVL
jgi:hypothetical protein